MVRPSARSAAGYRLYSDADVVRLRQVLFYPCSREMQRALGEGYVADARFTKNIDRNGAGLARYLRDAISARE